MNEQDLRDCFAMFACIGLLMRGDNGTAVPERAYEMADRMLQVRSEPTDDDDGIATIKKRKYVRKS